ncbi:glycerol-3-phosphate ABC transporter permease [Dietzia sp. HMSC21D01]|uniref:Carbohydrate ABC transporter permease n=1 Tax=Dietzia cinnamea TaxID=321318 RepID=A0AAW5QAU7_9ACTN|nr:MULTISPECIES: carbohydrate ABC transporter permease [Dietzia]KZO57555.1 glycerol-3-phosphate ABC transporter permease [Dietzia maris]MBM7231861.1 carbohydrate ABC transporter permease [Dietzia cinnamea]MCT1638813.1 carbohydrate ABC transporter permease [Dietzia cinnamea]MCT1711098.1 carbohydrate ABC transporter permease [Dietzia cinnamea]MCT1863938.1 carbohydrate ABC transporter permease [Dietzia cinnamea]
MNTIQGGSRTAKVAGYAVMVLVLLIIGLPLYWVVITSLKPDNQVYIQPPVWWPDPITTDSYPQVLADVPFLQYFTNSLVITGVLAAVKITLGVISAYAFVFLRFPGRGLLFMLVLAALMVPNQITVISNYAFIAQLGWINTFQGIIIPLAGVAFGTFLMRNHFLTLPFEIIEAARMDGCGHLKLLFRVVLPMSWPTLVAFALITVVNEWNEYLWPFLIASDDTVAPLQVGLARLVNTDGGFTDWPMVMAATVLTITPILIVFLILQRHMIKGLTSGAVKG